MENHPSAAKRDEEIYSRFMSLLFKHYREQREVRFYADKLFVPPKYASKVIAQLTGKSPQGWTQEMVITAEKSISPVHIAHTGLSPKKYWDVQL